MGIFGDSGQRGRSAAKGYDFAANECLEVLCDRCHAAWAKVEVITRAGPVFFCQHHHKKYRPSLIAAGYQIRAVLLTEISALALTGKPDDRRPCGVSTCSVWAVRRSLRAAGRAGHRRRLMA